MATMAVTNQKRQVLVKTWITKRGIRELERTCVIANQRRPCVLFLLGASDSGLALKSGVVFAGITHHESVQFVCGCIFPTLTLLRLRHGVETH